ncbi:MAG: hypothetical protein WCS42_00260 [Verrucomicrobiota bacterium]
MFGETVDTTALSLYVVSGTPLSDQFVPSFQSELVVPVQLLSTAWLSDALKERTMAVKSGAPKLELRNVAVIDFGFMDFWWFGSDDC